MHGRLSHFAIEADDVERARHFYEAVFGWTFSAWGPPNFYQIAGAGVHGALQERHNPPVEGLAPLQLTFAVENLEAAMEAIAAAGGELHPPVHEIPSVGRLVAFADSEGNEAMVMQYEPARAKEMGLA